MILKSSSPLSTCCCILQQQQMEDIRKAGGTMIPQRQTPPVPTFDSTELWKDYLLHFETFVNANSILDEKKSLVFFTNKTSDTYKLTINYDSQQDVPTTANAMQFSDITDFLSSHYDPTQYVTVRERCKF